MADLGLRIDLSFPDLLPVGDAEESADYS